MFKFLFLIFVLLVILVFFIAQLLVQKKGYNSSENSSINSIPPQLANVYKTLLYQVEYPKDWNYEKFNTVSGDSVIFKPLNNSAGSYYPSISVSITGDSKTPIETKEGIFLMYGFNKTEILINNHIFSKLSGTYPYKIVSGKSINTPVQETIIIAIKDKTEFLIKYQYEGSIVNLELEKKFNNIIATFRFL